MEIATEENYGLRIAFLYLWSHLYVGYKENSELTTCSRSEELGGGGGKIWGGIVQEIKILRKWFRDDKVVGKPQDIQ